MTPDTRGRAEWTEAPGMDGPARGALHDRASWSWRLNSSWFVLIGGARAAIMQVADPKIGAGVAAYSTYRTDPLGRLERTLDAMLTIGFGTPEQKERVLEDLRRMHAAVRGRTGEGAPYSALDPQLMYWVLATLFDTVMEVERRYVGRMDEHDRRDYFAETSSIVDAFGIPDRIAPQSLEDFRTYMADTNASLRPSDASRDISRTLLQPGLRWVPDTAFVPLDWVTLELLPSTMRRRLHLGDLSPGQLAAVRAAQRVSRSTLPRLPRQLATNPLTGRVLRRAA
ncbi:MAG: oxygenase MpaB family protein [Microthrixaceae bacterium]